MIGTGPPPGLWTIVFFKHLGSRHVYKEIKLQEGMNKIENMLCKTDLNLLRRMAYKCNTFNDIPVHFEAHLKSVYVPLWYPQFE